MKKRNELIIDDFVLSFSVRELTEIISNYGWDNFKRALQAYVNRPDFDRDKDLQALCVKEVNNNDLYSN